MGFWNMFFGKKDRSIFEDADVIDTSRLEESAIPFVKSAPPPLPKHPLLTKNFSNKNCYDLIKMISEKLPTLEKAGDILVYKNFKVELAEVGRDLEIRADDSFTLKLRLLNHTHLLKIEKYNFETIAECQIDRKGWISESYKLDTFEQSEYNNKDKVFRLITEIFVYGQPEISEKKKINNYFNKIGFNPNEATETVKINRGTHYLIVEFKNYRSSYGRFFYERTLYDFETWTKVNLVTYEDVYTVFGDDPIIEKCIHPKTEHWQHFLNLEIKEKRRRKDAAVEFINKILDDQQTYMITIAENGLQYDLPVIDDLYTFKYFCDKINQEITENEFYIETELEIILNERRESNSFTTFNGTIKDLKKSAIELLSNTEKWNEETEQLLTDTVDKSDKKLGFAALKLRELEIQEKLNDSIS